MSMGVVGFETKCSRTACRSCQHSRLLPVLDLGRMPLVDTLLPPASLARREPMYPLEVGLCPQCSLVQILETVPAEEVFHSDYAYYSSFSESLLAHSRANALALIESRRLSSQSLVIELASNDGYLLKNFMEKGIAVLGIDPCPGPVQAAQKIGVPTLCEFFGKDLAARLADEGKRADVVIANNVLAHVPDLNGFVAGIRTILKDDGVLVSESPYVRDLLDHCEFDTIYHEHLSYYSVTSLDHLFRRNGLYLNDVQRLSIHGGSLRIHVARHEAVKDSVRQYLAQEQQRGMNRQEYYRDFGQKVRELRDAMRTLLAGLKAQGSRIAAYGAAAKGVIMLNYIGFGPETIEYVADRNTHKQGKYIPGVRIVVCDPSRLLVDMPDYVMMLPWNLKDEILAQQEPYRRQGGRFIIPAHPQPLVV